MRTQNTQSKNKAKSKVQGVHNYKPQHFPDTKRKRKDKTKQAQIEQRAKSPKINSLFPKRRNRNAKRSEKHKSKITQGKT